MAAEIRSAFAIEPELVESSGGVFEVELDGTRVFSKKSLGRFPEPGEVPALLGPHLEKPK